MKINKIVICAAFCLGFFVQVMPAALYGRLFYNNPMINTLGLFEQFEEAVISGDLKGIKRILKLGISLKSLSRSEDVLVRVAENYKILKLVLKFGSDIQIEIVKYCITFALNRKDHLLLKTILEYYRNCNQWIDLSDVKDSLEQAIRNKDNTAVVMLLKIVDSDMNLSKSQALRYTNDQIQELASLIIDVAKISSKQSLDLSMDIQLKSMKIRIKELKDEIFTQDWLNIANREYSFDMITQDHNFQFLLEEGISLSDELSTEQLERLDHDNINSKVVSLVQEFSYLHQKMPNKMTEILRKFTTTDSLASEVFNKREKKIEDLLQAVLDNNINDVKRMLNQGLTLKQIKNSKKFTIDQIAWIDDMIEQISIDKETKAIEENLEKEFGLNEFSNDFIQAVLDNNVAHLKIILDHQNFPGHAKKLTRTFNEILMKYIINKKYDHILYELSKRDFIMQNNNDLFSQNLSLFTEQKIWMNTILKQVDDEKRLQEEIDQKNKIIETNLKEEISVIQFTIENNRILLAKKIEEEDPALLDNLIKDFKNQNGYLNRRLEESTRNAMQQIEMNKKNIDQRKQ